MIPTSTSLVATVYLCLCVVIPGSSSNNSSIVQYSGNDDTNIYQSSGSSIYVFALSFQVAVPIIPALYSRVVTVTPTYISLVATVYLCLCVVIPGSSSNNSSIVQYSGNDDTNIYQSSGNYIYVFALSFQVAVPIIPV